jgi:hypothetical protein
MYRESCCLPEDMNRPRGHKYPTFLSELGVAFIDTDKIREHPEVGTTTSQPLMQ